MDEASKLVAELQSKLTELDQRVWQYRRDMTSEFDKYAESLLRDVPQDVSETVSKCLAESMKGYSSLYPFYSKDPFESCAATGNNHMHYSNGEQSPQQPHLIPGFNTFLQPGENEEDLPRSPHAREQEFRGVFTPSYLPLLDSTNRNERRPSEGSLISPPPGRISPQPRSMDTTQVDASTSTTKSLLSTPENTRPPTPRRRNTDEVSVGSDWSEGGATRRSALRRSSSSSRQSPRRVRFDVAGEEVLPTASPRESRSVLTEEIPTTLGEMMDDEGGSEQIEDIEEQPPVPKRISSSQALRALSRSPLVDDGTTWTTVTAPPDGSASVATTNGGSESWKTEGEDEAVFTSNGTSNGTSPHQIKPSEPAHPAASESALSPESDDDLPSMPRLKRQPPSTTKTTTTTKMSSPPSSQTQSELSLSLSLSNPTSPTSSTRPSRSWKDLSTSIQQIQSQPPSKQAKFTPCNDSDDEGEMFPMDESEPLPPPPPAGQEDEDEEYDDFDTDAPTSPIGKDKDVAGSVPKPISKFSTSPARDIGGEGNAPAMPAGRGDRVGSYKGHPFSLPIVSPDVHARAVGMGDISTFVGSVDGRSGVDESDVRTFRGSAGGIGSLKGMGSLGRGGVGSFSGTPRSLSERMVFEDLRNENSKKGAEGDSQKKGKGDENNNGKKK